MVEPAIGVETHPSPSRERRVICFVKYVRFSNTNLFVEEQLRRVFPEFDVDVIDLRDFFTRPSLDLAVALGRNCLKILRGLFPGAKPELPLRDYVLHSLLRDPFVFRAMGRRARSILARETRPIAFTFQTQGLWDSSLPGIANFVYTDAVALTNLSYHGVDRHGLAPPAWIAEERRLIASAEKIFVMSDHVARSLTEHYGVPTTRVRTVLVGANVERPDPAIAPAGPDNKTIVFVGVDWVRKGGPELVEAFQQLPERHRDARLVIVGVSPAIDVPGCTVVGRVPPSQVPIYYRQAAIFCMPTKIEHFGIVFIEAMLHKLAVAAPRQGAAPDFITDRQTGCLFEPENMTDLVATLTWLLDHPVRRREIAEAGFAAVSDRYTWDAVGAALHREIIACPSVAAQLRV